MIAALYVETAGAYYGMDDVDPWGEARDARLYAGPWPVVAHPPCTAWCLMSNCRPEVLKNEDGGCFAAALSAVRTWGGVLEHPAYTRAWRAFNLAIPRTWGWTRSLEDEGWTCCVDQGQYGHRARKMTWLYYVGPDPPMLLWGDGGKRAATVRGLGHGRSNPTPASFRDALLDMARSAAKVPA